MFFFRLDLLEARSAFLRVLCLVARTLVIESVPLNHSYKALMTHNLLSRFRRLLRANLCSFLAVHHRLGACLRMVLAARTPLSSQMRLHPINSLPLGFDCLRTYQVRQRTYGRIAFVRCLSRARHLLVSGQGSCWTAQHRIGCGPICTLVAVLLVAPSQRTRLVTSSIIRSLTPLLAWPTWLFCRIGTERLEHRFRIFLQAGSSSLHRGHRVSREVCRIANTAKTAPET